jgi:cobalt-zinc-cadmium efflux system outer membrane protein
MNSRIVAGVAVGAFAFATSAFAQASDGAASRYIDAANGLSLEQAIARALEQEPSVRAARAEIDVARGMRLQAGLRPNPSITFERRDEPAGTDSQTMVGVEWPFDLFRRTGRIAVADREIDAARFAAADRERLLAAEVRMRYGEVLAAVREVTTLDEMADATRRQHELLRSRVEEGASPPLERDLLDVEMNRLESERLLQMGRTEAAVFELKRALGMPADAPLTVRDTLEDLVQAQSARQLPVPPAGTSVRSGQRPDVREAETQVAIAEARIDRAEQEGRFDASVFGSYMRMNAGFPQQGLGLDGRLERVRGFFHYLAGGVTFTLPLRNRNQGEVAAARAERTSAVAAFDAARLAAEAEIAAARQLDDYAQRAATRYSVSAQPVARRNLTVIRERYELGRGTVFDVLAEQRRYLDVERAYTEALRAAYDARTALEQALGAVR